MSNPSDDTLREILRSAKTIALVGASNDASKASHRVMAALQAAGYRVIPVNPNEAEILGERAYASLRDIPEPVDIVDVFRRPEHTPELAKGAVAIGAKVFWLQLGIINEEAAAIARAGGLTVVMDLCLAVEQRRLLSSLREA